MFRKLLLRVRRGWEVPRGHSGAKKITWTPNPEAVVSFCLPHEGGAQAVAALV